MKILNIEIKARCHDPDRVRSVLKTHDARYAGRDHQIDTYYEAPQGRLKLRQGNIENALIAYDRVDQSGPKTSDVLLYKTADSDGLKAILDKTLKTRIVVDKQRDIYFLDNVKFHVDEVEGLGNFVEIEVIDETGSASKEELRRQCERYITLLGITEDDLLTHSYSDMLFNQNEN
jgi:predicted adenylyl cyclase CyaB